VPVWCLFCQYGVCSASVVFVPPVWCLFCQCYILLFADYSEQSSAVWSWECWQQVSEITRAWRHLISAPSHIETALEHSPFISLPLLCLEPRGRAVRNAVKSDITWHNIWHNLTVRSLYWNTRILLCEAQPFTVNFCVPLNEWDRRTEPTQPLPINV
jgi:hypothetical protein